MHHRLAGFNYVRFEGVIIKKVCFLFFIDEYIFGSMVLT